MPYENPTKDLTQKEIAQLAGHIQAIAMQTKGKCIHIPNRPVHRTIKVRASLRVMDMCKECYGVMDRAGCIAKVV